MTRSCGGNVRSCPATACCGSPSGHTGPVRIPALGSISALALTACIGSSATTTHDDAGSTMADAAAVDASLGDGAAAPIACTAPPSCLHGFTLPGTAFTLPYYATLPIDEANPQITSVVVFNQGLDRDADNDFSTLVTAAQTANALGHTLVLTPHFEALVNADGTPCTGHTDTPASTDLLWTCDAWSDGLASTNSPQVTSYGALDAMLTVVLATFPGAHVTVSGFSAGGQLTQRYVAVNRVDPGTTNGAGAAFHYVVGDPSSYLYFDARRPANASTCTSTGCPDGLPVYVDDGGCPGFDDWKYGTGALEGAAASSTPTQLEQAYVARRVTYLLGMLDDAATTAADYADLDVTCAAEAQGAFRYQRGLAFYAYATGLLDAGGSALFTVPGCAHSAPCVFQSDAGIAAVFGE